MCSTVRTCWSISHQRQRRASSVRHSEFCGRGTLRLAVPDLRILVTHDENTGDADALIESMPVSHPPPASLISRIAGALIGPRHHQWMYDGDSLCRLVERHGFRQATVMPAGTTTIPNPGNLNLHERADESVYVEAKKH